MSNHFGGLGGGHYTAFAKLNDSGQWYCFDDSYTRRIQPEDVVTSNAYVLFYRRKQETDQDRGKKTQIACMFDIVVALECALYLCCARTRSLGAKHTSESSVLLMTSPCGSKICPTDSWEVKHFLNLQTWCTERVRVREHKPKISSNGWKPWLLLMVGSCTGPRHLLLLWCRKIKCWVERGPKNGVRMEWCGREWGWVREMDWSECNSHPPSNHHSHRRGLRNGQWLSNAKFAWKSSWWRLRSESHWGKAPEKCATSECTWERLVVWRGCYGI